MICTNCGNQLSKHLNYCIHCGNPVPQSFVSDQLSSKNTSETDIKSILSSEIIESKDFKQEIDPEIKSISKNNKNKLNSLIWIGVFVISVTLIGLIIFFRHTFFQENVKSKKEDQILNNNEVRNEQPIKQVDLDHSQFISIPIDNLFKAWSGLDLNLYMSQWDGNGVQYSNKFEPRNYQEIMKGRKSLFERLTSVEIIKYNISNIIEQTKDRVSLNVQYSMHFNFKNGKIINETNIMEKYVLRYDLQGERWIILENYDYID